MTRITKLPALALAVCGLVLAGCQLTGSSGGTGGAGELPNLPQTAVSLTPGAQAVYQGWAFELGEVTNTEYQPEATIRLTPRKASAGAAQSVSISVGRFALARPFLLTVSNLEIAESEATVRVWHLPSWSERAALPDAEDGLVLKEGEQKFLLGGGFIALERIRENDYDSTNDDEALVTVLAGDELRELAVKEYGSVAVGDEAVLRAADIYPGNTPGGGQASLRLLPADRAWRDAEGQERVAIIGGEGAEAQGIVIRADTLADRNDRMRAVLELELGEVSRRGILYPGESLRLGSVEVRVDSAEDGVADLTAFTFAEPTFAEAARVEGGRARADAEEEERLIEESRRVTRTMTVPSAVEFHGASFRLVRVFENDRTNLFDDVAEFQVEHGNISERRLIREGQRDTVYGNNRWWVVEAVSLRPGERGGAEIVLETGQFVGLGDEGYVGGRSGPR